MDAQSMEVCCRYDSDATEGIQDEKVGISCDYPIGTTADRQLKHLVVLGIATGSNRLGDLYQLGVPVKPRACAFCVISAMTSWRDSSVLVTSRRRRLRRRSSFATIQVRRGSIGVSQIRIHGDRDCVRHLRPPLVATRRRSLDQGSTSRAGDPPTVDRPSSRARSDEASAGRRFARHSFAFRSRTSRLHHPVEERTDVHSGSVLGADLLSGVGSVARRPSEPSQSGQIHPHLKRHGVFRHHVAAKCADVHVRVE